MTLTFYDLSNYQGGMDLAKDARVKDAQAFIFKATEGIYFVDKTCDNFVNQAKSLKKPWGVYHFLDGTDVVKQAEFFYNNVKGYIGQGVMVLDYEMYGRQGAAAVERFVKRFYELSGVYVWLYMNESDSNSDTWSDYLKKNCGLWIAKYSTQKPNHVKGLNVIGWQYTSTPLDKNTFYGDASTWAAYAKSSKVGSQGTTVPQAPAPSLANYWTDGTKFKAKADLPIKKTGDFSKDSGLIIRKGETFDIAKLVNTGTSTHCELVNNIGMVTLHKSYVDKVK